MFHHVIFRLKWILVAVFLATKGCDTRVIDEDNDVHYLSTIKLDKPADTYIVDVGQAVFEDGGHYSLKIQAKLPLAKLTYVRDRIMLYFLVCRDEEYKQIDHSSYCFNGQYTDKSLCQHIPLPFNDQGQTFYSSQVFLNGSINLEVDSELIHFVIANCEVVGGVKGQLKSCTQPYSTTSNKPCFSCQSISTPQRLQDCLTPVDIDSPISINVDYTWCRRKTSGCLQWFARSQTAFQVLAFLFWGGSLVIWVLYLSRNRLKVVNLQLILTAVPLVRLVVAMVQLRQWMLLDTGVPQTRLDRFHVIIGLWYFSYVFVFVILLSFISHGWKITRHQLSTKEYVISILISLLTSVSATVLKLWPNFSFTLFIFYAVSMLTVGFWIFSGCYTNREFLKYHLKILEKAFVNPERTSLHIKHLVFVHLPNYCQRYVILTKVLFLLIPSEYKAFKTILNESCSWIFFIVLGRLFQYRFHRLKYIVYFERQFEGAPDTVQLNDIAVVFDNDVKPRVIAKQILIENPDDTTGVGKSLVLRRLSQWKSPRQKQSR